VIDQSEFDALKAKALATYKGGGDVGGAGRLSGGVATGIVGSSA
jgi:hypothetical protein